MCRQRGETRELILNMHETSVTFKELVVLQSSTMGAARVPKEYAARPCSWIALPVQSAVMISTLGPQLLD